MKFIKHLIPTAISICIIGLFFAHEAKAQTATISIQTTPASCSGGGSVTGSVSVPGACSVDGFLPCTNASLHGPGQSGSTFNTCDSYQVGANNLAPGEYYYQVNAISPCFGSATFPFTIEQEGVFPDIEITNNPIDCNEDDFITIQNNTSVTVNIGSLDGPSLGTIAAGQSEVYTHASLNIPFSGNFTFTASTSSCSTPVEFPGEYPDGLTTPSATVNTTDASSGMSNGSATVFVENGFGPWTINWSNGVSVVGEITSTINDLAPGDYSVEVIAGNGCSYSEAFVITDGSTGIENLSAVFGNVSIFPNPATGNVVNVRVDAFQGQRLTLALINAVGQEVVSPQSFEVVQGSNTLNLDLATGMTNGIYYLKIMSDDRVGSLQLMYTQD